MRACVLRSAKAAEPSAPASLPKSSNNGGKPVARAATGAVCATALMPTDRVRGLKAHGTSLRLPLALGPSINLAVQRYLEVIDCSIGDEPAGAQTEDPVGKTRDQV